MAVGLDALRQDLNRHGRAAEHAAPLPERRPRIWDLQVSKRVKCVRADTIQSTPLLHSHARKCRLLLLLLAVNLTPIATRSSCSAATGRWRRSASCKTMGSLRAGLTTFRSATAVFFVRVCQGATRSRRARVQLQHPDNSAVCCATRMHPHLTSGAVAPPLLRVQTQRRWSRDA